MRFNKNLLLGRWLLPSLEQVKWIKAAEDEISSHVQYGTWVSSDLSKDKKAINRKRIFQLKYDAEVYEDNQECIKLTQGQKLNARTKHIDIRYRLLYDL